MWYLPLCAVITALLALWLHFVYFRPFAQNDRLRGAEGLDRSVLDSSSGRNLVVPLLTEEEADL